MQQGYSLPRHVEIARSPEQYRSACDHLIAELKRGIKTAGYAKVAVQTA
jgi:hypothetical protein